MTSSAPPQPLPDFARRFPNLALPRLGCEVVAASDEFFAPKERMISPSAPVFIPGKYDDHGKWMDGWETRRRREAGNDWCVLRLGAPARIFGADLDTAHFTGNYPPAAILESAANNPKDWRKAKWTPLAPRQALGPNARHFLPVAESAPRQWLRLSIFPDGGIARLRVFGLFAPPQKTSAETDLAAMMNGARIVAASDSHFGAPENLLAPGPAENMGDGWETRRRREPGFDWVIAALARPGVIRRAEIDTTHFKGNFPASCVLRAAHAPDADDESLVAQSMFWDEILPRRPLSADRAHRFEKLNCPAAVSHARLEIHPDGGVARLRLFGAAKK